MLLNEGTQGPGLREESSYLKRSTAAKAGARVRTNISAVEYQCSMAEVTDTLGGTVSGFSSSRPTLIYLTSYKHGHVKGKQGLKRARIRQSCGPCQALVRTPQAALSQCHWPCRKYFYYLVSWYASTKQMRLVCSPLDRGKVMGSFCKDGTLSA